MAPNVTVTFTCTQSGITSSLTNTLTATADNGAGTILTQTATASVTVPAAAAGPSTLAAPSRSTSSNSSRYATLTVTAPKTIHLHAKHPSLDFTVTLSKATTLHLTLLDARGKPLASWTEPLSAGKHTLTLRLPLRTRHPGRDKLRIAEPGNPAVKTLAVNIAV
jgi:hypothetical protein